MNDGDPCTLRALADLEKRFIDLLAAHEKLDAARHAASDTAIAKAERSDESWRANANEWRGLVSDVISKNITRAEHERSYAALDGKLELLEKAIDRRGGWGEGVGAVWGYIVGAAGIGAFAVAIIWRH